jgi:predicted nucleic acid-binding protein
MSLVIVDASVWIDYLKGITTTQTEWLDSHLGEQRLGLTDISLCEVLQGVRPHEATRIRDYLLSFEVLPTGGTGLALDAAENYRALRALGITVRKTIDCWIAAFCLREGHTLLHSDRDFQGFEQHLGLQVVGQA